MSFVLDTSVTLTWLFEDEASEYGDNVAAALPAEHALVPDLWYLEVANALAVGERRKRVIHRVSLPDTGERDFRLKFTFLWPEVRL